VWAHLEAQREAVKARAQEALGGRKPYIQTAGPTLIEPGTTLSIRLRVEGLTIDEPESSVLWIGEIANTTFSCQVPKDAVAGPRAGVAEVYVHGLRAVRVQFEIRVGSKTSAAGPIPTRERRPASAFVSYASEDRDEVLARIQGIQKTAPDMNIFLDVLSLRSGENWAERLWREIPARDIFYLFWSKPASQSPWVEKEWMCALETRGLDFIDPVPLVSPDVVAPPPQLASKHFNDWVLAFRRKS
jgi:hypothetical protein